MVIALLLLLIVAGCTPPPQRAPDRAAELVAAARADSVAALQQLLADGVSPDTSVAGGDRPLIEAARNGRVAAVTALIAGGARLDLADSTGARAIDYAVANGRREVTALLVRAAAHQAGLSREAQAWFDAVGRPDSTLPGWTRALDGELLSLGLCYAALEGRADAVMALRRSAGVPNRTGYSALAFAARFGELATVRALLAAGANPDIEAHNVWHETPLMDAARDGYVEIGAALIRAGARVDHFDVNHETALMWAVREGETEYAAMLLGDGANPALRNRAGDDARDLAEAINHHDLIELLSAPRARRQ